MKHCKWLFVLGLFLPPQASAQVFLKATLEDASAMLRLQIFAWQIPTDVVGFDIYRFDAWSHTGTGMCPEDDWAAGTLVTPTVLPRQAGVYEMVDSEIQNDHLYLYRVTSVDANRKPIAVGWVEFLSVGRALVAEAKVVQGACDAGLESCPAACFQDGTVVQGIPRSIVGDGRFYRMYGHIAAPPTPMSAGTITYVDEVVPMECSTTAVAPSTWGRVKTLFRD